MIHSLISKLDNVFTFDSAAAHCDIPCKIYDPSTAQIAALSVIRFVDIMNELGNESELCLENIAQLSRLVQEKEIHVQKVKDEIVVIWGDYFKQPQFAVFPDISQLVHSIMLAGSACKQHISREKAETLLLLVNQFTEAFWATKDIETYATKCPYPPYETVVYPKLASSLKD